MRDYRIAYFTADWNYELVETTLHGLKQYVSEHENVYVRVFDCFGKDLGSVQDDSEYAIFGLAELSRFDGVLIQGNQIVLRSVREEIARRVKEAGLPALSIDCPIEGCTLIGIDNERAQHDITEHVIRKHGAKRLTHLTGIMENGCPEGRQRLNGFLSACRENGVRPEDVEVVEGTWRTSDGSDAARRYLAGGRPLPDAFICANDDMALGMIEVFKERGVRLPEAAIVTGFDNLTSAELSSPRLSTIHRDYDRMDYLAMQVLIDKIDGKPVPDRVSFDYQVICSTSCGCDEGARPGYIRDKYFRQTRFLKNFYSLQDDMAEELFEASTLPELAEIVEKHSEIFGCDNVYLCFNDFYYDNYDREQDLGGDRVFGEEMVLAGKGGAQVRFPTRSLLPEGLADDARFLMFYPLHYNTHSIGYLAMDGISEAAKLNLHKSIFSFLEIAIENVRKKGLLRQLNGVLDDLYVHDALTKLYNRFGYERYGQQRFDRFMAEDGGVQILFVDMDDMKNINDRFGHEVGDAAICATADVLRRACGGEDFLMRYGGDEFLIVAPSGEAGLEDAIQRAVAEWNAGADMPFRLSLSIGVIRARADEGRGMDECVQAADAMMYDRKKRRKAKA